MREGALGIPGHTRSPHPLLKCCSEAHCSESWGPGCRWGGHFTGSMSPQQSQPIPRPTFRASPAPPCTLISVCAHTCTQMYTRVCAHAGSARVMRSGHLPARCTPAANQSLEGAAGGDPQGDEGSQRSPEVPTAPHGGRMEPARSLSAPQLPSPISRWGNGALRGVGT